MTTKERMLAALRDEPSDRIPWAPRLDLWYAANKRAGTLPRKYRDASLRDLTDDCGMGFHAVVPNFRDLRGPEDDADRCLGIYDLRTMPYRTVLRDVRRSVRQEGERTFVEYETPKGTVNAVVLYDESMRRAGVSITHLEETIIRGPEDFAAVGHIFENAEPEPAYEQFEEFADYVGDRCLSVAFVNLAASPLQLIQRELMRLDEFFYAMHDRPHELLGLAAQMNGYWERTLRVVVESPADVIFIGANYDASVTYPPFFEEHIQPWLRRYAQECHDRGKYLLTHTDGENAGLLEHYVESEIDIADSVCPKPMTSLTLKETRDVFAGRVSVMGGIPSVALLEQSMSDVEFDKFLDRFFAELGRGDHLMLGVSDTTPPAADFHRLLRVGERVKAFGPVEPA